MQPWHLWTIAGIVLIILEMLTPAFFFASFALACLFAAAGSAAGLGTTGVLAVFAGASVLCMFAVRPVFVNLIYRRSDPTPTNRHAMIGLTGTVVDDIEDADGPGRVKVGSEEWRAVSGTGAPIRSGTRVEVLRVDSATLTVRARL